MAEFRKGGFCISKAGHDSGTVYVVVEDRPCVYVCDGKRRLLSNPKRKNPAHLQPVNYRDEALECRLEAGKLRDEDVKYSIKNYLIHIGTRNAEGEA